MLRSRVRATRLKRRPFGVSTMMRPLHWVVWIAGLISSICLLAVFGMGKGGPAWYAVVFFVAAGLCLLSAPVNLYLRRTQRPVVDRDLWIEALSTFRLGFLVVLGTACFVAILLVARPWR